MIEAELDLGTTQHSASRLSYDHYGSGFNYGAGSQSLQVETPYLGTQTEQQPQEYSSTLSWSFVR